MYNFHFSEPNEKAPPVMKKKTRENQLPWIPIDPTLLLPYHIANNRIPATFLPKGKSDSSLTQ